MTGHSFAAAGSSSKVTLPSTGLLENLNKDSTDESTVIDTEMKEYPPFVSATGASSAVVDFAIHEVGFYTGSEVQYLTNPVELQPTNLTDEVTVEIQVENMPADFNPTCVYASQYNEVTRTTTWSTAGVYIHEVKREESVVVCKSTHLSRFTANENVEDELSSSSEPLIENIVIAEKDSEDDKEFDIFPIMIGIASFLVFLIIIVSLSERRSKKKTTNWRTARTSSVMANSGSNVNVV